MSRKRKPDAFDAHMAEHRRLIAENERLLALVEEYRLLLAQIEAAQCFPDEDGRVSERMH